MAVVLVTGAAGAIGSATARLFLDAGFDVVGIDRAASAATGAHPRYTGLRADLSDDAALSAVIAEAERVGPLAHVVGIAGGALPEEARTQEDPAALTPETFRASIEANLTTQFLMLRAVLPWLRGTQDGDRSIAFTSSFNALTGCGMPAYSAAKAGLIGLMHALVGPLGVERIRVNVVAPGTVRTPRTEQLYAHDDGHFEQLEAGAAIGLARPDDVGRTFLALATLLTRVTGQVIVVDGGQMVKRTT